MIKKKNIQDITPKHRSIRDISIEDVGRDESTRRKIEKKLESKPLIKKAVRRSVALPEEESHHFDFNSEYVSHSHKPRWGMVIIWFAVILALLGCFVFISSFFHSTNIDLKIKETTTPVDLTVNMVRKVESGVLPFEIVSLSKEASEIVPANGEKEVSVKATGRVVIYNKNTVAQKLISQTRLEAPSGKIYRLTSTVTVAGAKKSGSTLIPGSLEVTATADAPGPSYNSGLVDLTIPGFKGTAKYETIYARSKTPFENGASGIVKVAEKEDLQKAQEKIKDDLSKQLLSSANQQIPNSFILLPNIYSIRYSSSTQETKDNLLMLKQKADFVGVLVDSKKISELLAKKAIPGYSGESILVSNLKDLSYSYASSSVSLGVNTNNLSISIKGDAHFVYGYDAEGLKADLAGISRESFATVIATYAGIEKGNSTIKPFWRSKFPTDLGKIIINEEK
jgi:hypothetical protein